MPSTTNIILLELLLQDKNTVAKCIYSQSAKTEVPNNVYLLLTCYLLINVTLISSPKLFIKLTKAVKNVYSPQTLKPSFTHLKILQNTLDYSPQTLDTSYFIPLKIKSLDVPS